jgi:hypothetical protein
MRIDAAVSAEVLHAISPLAIEAALQLIADHEQAGAERLRQSELALQQARYEETYARRQYDAIDPDNRLVAGELERRWNERLAAVARLEEQIENLRREQPRVLHDDERKMLLALADDLPRVWNHPAASTQIRKRILRTVLKEIVVTIEGDRLCLMVHWQGGDHTRLEVVKTALAKIALRPLWRPCSSSANSPACCPIIASPRFSTGLEYVQPEDMAGLSSASATSVVHTRLRSIVRANEHSDMS